MVAEEMHGSVHVLFQTAVGYTHTVTGQKSEEE